MNGRRFPRYGRMILVVGVMLAGALLFLLYQQYQLLSERLANTPPVDHQALALESFLWIAAGAMAAVLICLGIVAIMVRREEGAAIPGGLMLATLA